MSFNTFLIEIVKGLPQYDLTIDENNNIIYKLQENIMIIGQRELRKYYEGYSLSSHVSANSIIKRTIYYVETLIKDANKSWSRLI